MYRLIDIIITSVTLYKPVPRRVADLYYIPNNIHPRKKIRAIVVSHTALANMSFIIIFDLTAVRVL